MILPFLDNQTNNIKRNLNIFHSFKLKMFMESGVKLGNNFNFKDSLLKIIRSLIDCL